MSGSLPKRITRSQRLFAVTFVSQARFRAKAGILPTATRDEPARLHHPVAQGFGAGVVVLGGQGVRGRLEVPWLSVGPRLQGIVGRHRPELVYRVDRIGLVEAVETGHPGRRDLDVTPE